MRDASENRETRCPTSQGTRVPHVWRTTANFRAPLHGCTYLTVHLTLLPHELPKSHTCTPSNVWPDTRSPELLPSLITGYRRRPHVGPQEGETSIGLRRGPIDESAGVKVTLLRYYGFLAAAVKPLNSPSSPDPGGSLADSQTCFLATRECDETRSPTRRDSRGQEGGKDSVPLACRCPWIHHPPSHVTRVVGHITQSNMNEITEWSVEMPVPLTFLRSGTADAGTRSGCADDPCPKA